MADRPNKVEPEDVVYADRWQTRCPELQMACKKRERDLPHSGSKKRLLDRLIVFRVNIENKMKLNVANRLSTETYE